LADGVDVPDAIGEDGGVAGGTNAHGQVLPPVVFQQQPIDTTGGWKIQGALKGSLVFPDDGCSESETDSDEDMEDDDMHKLRQLSHTARLKQPITVRIIGQFAADGDQKH
jgi:hypothetical protein